MPPDSGMSASPIASDRVQTAAAALAASWSRLLDSPSDDEVCNPSFRVELASHGQAPSKSPASATQIPRASTAISTSPALGTGVARFTSSKILDLVACTARSAGFKDQLRQTLHGCFSKSLMWGRLCGARVPNIATAFRPALRPPARQGLRAFCHLAPTSSKESALIALLHAAHLDSQIVHATA